MTEVLVLIVTVAQLRLIWVWTRKLRTIVAHWDQMARLAGEAITVLPFPEQYEFQQRATLLVRDQIRELQAIRFWGW